MKNKDTLGGLLGKAKLWAKKELENSTMLKGSPLEHRRAEEENAERRRELERDAEQARNDAIVEALLPQGLKDFRDKMESDRAAAEVAREARARATREARVTNAAVTLTGAVSGVATGLAVTTERLSAWDDGTADGTEDGSVDESVDESEIEPAGNPSAADRLFVTVEAVDPVPMVGGTFCGFSFEIPAGGADGVYPVLDTPEFDAMQYSLFLEEDNEGWFFHPSYGPGSVTVSAGVAAVDLTLGSSGSETIVLSASVPLR